MSETQPMKVIHLQAENFKRIRAIDITPGEGVVTVAGRNGAGKSSVLDSIAGALGGAELCPVQPIRRGENSATVEVAIGDLVVRRKWTEKGTTLEVLAPGGAKYPRPQSVLDALIGQLTFDPLQFAREKPQAQRDTLMAMLGLRDQLAVLDGKRAKVFDERTELGRFLRQLEGQKIGEGMLPAGVPADRVDVFAEVEKLSAARKAIQENAAVRGGVAIKQREHTERISRLRGFEAALIREQKAAAGRIHEWESNVAECEARLQAARAALERTRLECQENERQNILAIQEAKDAEQLAREDYGAAKVQADALVDPDPAPIEAVVRDADRVNSLVARRERMAEIESKIKAKGAEIEAKTNRMAEIDAEKLQLMTTAQWPIDGLSFAESGVLYNGIPFEQASSSEQLRVSLAIGMALNPKLRVLLIRDGSLLDSASLAAIGEMAHDRDYQVWIETVDESGEVGIVIEDGRVAAVKS